jgi:hypothetical protein
MTTTIPDTSQATSIRWNGGSSNGSGEDDNGGREEMMKVPKAGEKNKATRY